MEFEVYLRKYLPNGSSEFIFLEKIEAISKNEALGKWVDAKECNNPNYLKQTKNGDWEYDGNKIYVNVCNGDISFERYLQQLSHEKLLTEYRDKVSRGEPVSLYEEELLFRLNN